MRLKIPVRYILILVVLILTACSSARFARLGEQALNIGEYTHAIEKFQKAVRQEQSPEKKLEMTYKVAECYRRIGDSKKAEIWYKNAISKGFLLVEAKLNYAEVLQNNEKYADAITFYSQYLDSVPDNQRALNGIESCKKATEWIKTPTRFEVKIEKALNSRFADYAPVFVGAKDNEIIFTSTRESVKGRKKSGIHGQRYSDLFSSNYDIQKQRWESPKSIDDQKLINTLNDEGAATFNTNGDEMIFTRCDYKKKQSNGATLFISKRSKTDWSEATKIEVCGDSLIAAHPSLSANGNTLYFVSDMEGGEGGKDIWVAEKSGDTWGKPENLGKDVNTPGDEMFPFIRDNGELYFSTSYRVGLGGLDIFKASRQKGKDGKPGIWVVENMMSPINSTGDDFSITFIADRDQGMFASNRKGTRGDDIYSFVLPPKIFKVDGEIVDNATNNIISNSNIRLIGTDGTMLKVRSENGKFQFKLKPETEYIIASFKEGYLNAKATFSTVGKENNEAFNVQLKMTSVVEPFKLENIKYASAKWDLLPESISSLDSLVEILNQNPTITIEIMAHTDFVGSDQFNSDLSQKRAQSVVNYLIEKKISPRRLVAKGYGETWPKSITREIAKTFDFLKKGDELTEAFITSLATDEQKEIAKGLNRRTEFRVLSFDFHDTVSPQPQKR